MTYNLFEMSSYFITITFINLFTLLMLSICILLNTVINKIQKKDFLITIIVIFTICIMEVITIIVDASPKKFIWLNILSNYMGFSLTPIVFLCLGNAVFPNRRFRWLFFANLIYMLWLLITQILRTEYSVFFIDSLNKYSRAKCFSVYIIFYILSLIYFFIENIRLSIRFWHTNSIILLINFIFVITGTTIQVIYPDIQVTWLCVVISITIYYIYHDTLYQQLDSQTYLMNQNSFQKWLENQNKPAVLVIAEIDNFSKLKLNYSRKTLDEIIVRISQNFNNNFKKYGRCYRIETEEFCAVIYNTSLNFDELNKNFFINFIKENINSEEMPLITLGYSQISPHEDLNHVLSNADIKKRLFLKERINYLR